jgi:hypothetical protein
MYEDEFGEIVLTKKEKELIKIEETHNKLVGWLPDYTITLLNNYAQMKYLGLDTIESELKYQRELIWSQLKPVKLQSYDGEDDDEVVPEIPKIGTDFEDEEEDTVPYFPTIEEIIQSNQLQFTQKKKVSFEKRRNK